MKIKQLNKENVGIDVNNNPPDGYQHDDGLVFDDTHPAWIIDSDFNKVAKDILNKYPDAKTILDVGSGAGNLSHNLIEHNPDLIVVTLDGNMETINSPLIDVDNHFLLRTDIDYTLVDENGDIIKFDLICSFEHFEHIYPETFNIFIENLKKHSHSNTILIASAAKWRYPNTNVHCNVKSEEDWNRELTTQYNMVKIEDIILNHKNWKNRIKFTHNLHYKMFKK